MVGTEIITSPIPFILPCDLPVRITDLIFFNWADLIAFKTFVEFPLVEIATRTSPEEPIPSICLEKI